MSTQQIVSDFKSVYEQLDADHLDVLNGLYDEHILFVDPFHRIEGLNALKHYFTGLYQNINSCDFLFKEDVIQSDTATVFWTMRLAHRRLSNKTIEVDGCSYLKIDGRIHYHRDYFDAAQLLYENIPVLGYVVRKIKSHV